ncbi:MAG: ABC transporter permease subunit [Anaerolineae bacterium]
MSEDARAVVPPAEATRPLRGGEMGPEPAPVANTASRRTLVSVLRFVTQRLAFALTVLVAIIYLSYLGLDMAGGTGLHKAAGLALARTADWLRQAVLAGDLGLSHAGSATALPRPVIEVVAERLPRSLGLLGVSLSFATLLGVGLGMLGAYSRRHGSLVVLLATMVGVSVPSFFAAFLLQWAVTSLTRGLGRSLLPVGGFGWDRHLLLPALVLAARPLAQITRMAFVTTRQVLEEDYVRTARSKGLRQRRVILVHVMRNTALPILTTVSVSLRYALSSLPVVELYFGWTGAGLTLLKGIAQRDDATTVSLVVCLGGLFLLVNLLLDASYRLIDPRLRQAPSFIRASERHGILDLARSLAYSVRDLLIANPLIAWFRRKSAAGSGARGPWSGNPRVQQTTAPVITRRRSWRVALTNPPLIAGVLLALPLVVVVLFGPRLAPNDPSQTQGLTSVGGEFRAPPFAPSADYPWGTDALGRGLMSLVFAGARQTLTLALLAVGARTLVGVALGALAGWTAGSLLDRATLALSEVVAAFPALLLAMTLILALGIRRGIPPFVLALCFVGWGEIMQFVRGQVIAIRPRPYIESAVAVGARTPRILARHVLPQLFSALTSIVALEMGSVLMLLGELGFVSIFIGGGTLIAQTSGQLVLHSDVPEWGAMLSSLRYLARSYPWTALYPMAAFFVAILAFNLLGEGTRRLLENGDLLLSRIANRYALAIIVVGLVAFRWASAHAGPMPFYELEASAFGGERALQHVAALTEPPMEGRALGSPGMERAAEYVATQFEALGLQSAGQVGTYFQERDRSFERIRAVPELAVDDGGSPLRYHSGFSVLDSPYMSLGEAQAPVRFVCLGERIDLQGVVWRLAYPDLDRADFRGQILLTPSMREAETMNWVPMDGMLVIAEDESQIARHTTVGGRARQGAHPRLWVSETVAERLLQGSGYTLRGIRDQCAALAAEQVLDLPLPHTVSARVRGELEERWPVRNVIGLIPGTHSFDYCFDCLAKQLIVVMAQYDSPPSEPTGEVYPAASDNASGVAVMLEAIRVLQETGYQPYKSLLFVAYSGEGLEGGEYVSNPNVTRFLSARSGLMGLEPEAIIDLHAVGAGSGSRLEVSAAGSLRLAELMEDAARRVGLRTVRASEAIDLSVIYDERGAEGQRMQEAPIVRLSWEGWEAYSRLPSDTMEIVSSERLEKAGRSLALALMVLGRERTY